MVSGAIVRWGRDMRRRAVTWLVLLLGLWPWVAGARILLEEVRFRPDPATPGARVRVEVVLRNAGERRAPALRVLFLRLPESREPAFVVSFRGRARPRPGETVTRGTTVPAREVREPGRRCYLVAVVRRRDRDARRALARGGACFTVAAAGTGAPPADGGEGAPEEKRDRLRPLLRGATATALAAAGAHGFVLDLAHPEPLPGPRRAAIPEGRLELWLVEEGRRLGTVDVPKLRPGESRRVRAFLWAPIPWGRCAYVYRAGETSTTTRLCVGEPELRVVAWIDTYRVEENGVPARRVRTDVGFVLWCGVARECPGSGWASTTLLVEDGASGGPLAPTVWRRIRPGDRPTFQLIWQAKVRPAGTPEGAGSGRWSAEIGYRTLLRAAERRRPHRRKGGVRDTACRRDPGSYGSCLRVLLVAAFDPTPVEVDVTVLAGGLPVPRPGP